MDINFPCDQAAVSGGAAQPRNERSAGGKDFICNTIFTVSIQYLRMISTISTHNICTLYLQYIQVHNPRPVAYRDRDWVLGEAYR